MSDNKTDYTPPAGGKVNETKTPSKDTPTPRQFNMNDVISSSLNNINRLFNKQDTDKLSDRCSESSSCCSDENNYQAHLDKRWACFQQLLDSHSALCSAFLKLVELDNE